MRDFAHVWAGVACATLAAVLVLVGALVAVEVMGWDVVLLASFAFGSITALITVAVYAFTDLCE